MEPAPFALFAPRGGAGDRARAFERARRHSARVRALRRGLEIGVVGGLVALVGWAAFRNFGRALRDVAFEGIGIEGGRLTMDRPHLTGARPGGGGYDITAAKATQDPRHPGAVDLALIGGQITTSDREESRLSASSGHYESDAETLDLSGDVTLQNPRYEVFLQSVHIEFKKGDYVSDAPVKARILPDTLVTADAMAVRGGGAQASFSGHVTTLINGQNVAVGEPAAVRGANP